MKRFFSSLEVGQFIERINRFVCRVKKRDGSQQLVYLPNPGRLWELLIPGVEVLLEPVRDSTRKYGYTMVAVRHNGQLIMLHTHKTNDAAEYLLQREAIEPLKGWVPEKREVSLGGSRFDFLLSKGSRKLVLEVKSCTLFHQRWALFPDAVTARGTRHLAHLNSLPKHYQTAVLMLVHSPEPQFFSPDFHTDIAFARQCLLVRSRVQFVVQGIEWDEHGEMSAEVSNLKIPWEGIAEECVEHGLIVCVAGISHDPVRVMKSVEPSKVEWKIQVLAVPHGMDHCLKVLSTKKRRAAHLPQQMLAIRDHAFFWKILPIRTSLADTEPIMRRFTAMLQQKAYGSLDSHASVHYRCITVKENPFTHSWFMNDILELRVTGLDAKVATIQ